MIKIIHLSNPIGRGKGGGISAVVKDYMIYQNHSKFIISLWFPGSNEYDKELEKYQDFRNKIKLIGLFGKSNAQKIFLPKILDELKTVDIIHQHSLWLLPSVLSLLFSKLKKKKVIIQAHGALAPQALKRSSYKKYVARFLYENSNMRNASMFIANSKKELEDIKKIFPLKEVALIPHGIPLDYTYDTYINKPKFVNIPEFDSLIKGKKVILFLSRIHPIKGIDRLIYAVSRIEKFKIEDVIFIIAGNGEINYINYLKKLINKYAINKYFVFTGLVDKKNKIALLDRSSGFILPSHTESFSLSIVEAMSRGLPIITTKGTPWSELVENKCGFWVENSKEGVLEGLNTFFDKTEEELKEFGSNAKKLVISKYILENNISKYEELYKYVLGQNVKPDFIY